MASPPSPASSPPHRRPQVVAPNSHAASTNCSSSPRLLLLLIVDLPLTTVTMLNFEEHHRLRHCASSLLTSPRCASLDAIDGRPSEDNQAMLVAPEGRAMFVARPQPASTSGSATSQTSTCLGRLLPHLFHPRGSLANLLFPHRATLVAMIPFWLPVGTVGRCPLLGPP